MCGDWSRRAVLTAAGAFGTAALAPSATARVTTRMVIPGVDEFTGDEDLPGYFVHLGGEASVDTDPADVDGCGFENWSPTDLTAYDARLLDRLDQEHRETETNVHVAGNADVDTGTLWIVNRQVSCPDDHVGLEVEQVGAAMDVPADATATEGAAPGFGSLAALGGLLAGGLGLARSRENDE